MASLEDIKLTPENILKKQFRAKMKGYDQEEVDAYLDQIISDYENYDKIIANLQNQIASLNQQLAQAKASQNNTFKSKVEDDDVKTYNPTKVSNSNYDESSSEITTNVAMIQRISTLERKVYNIEQRLNHQDRTYKAN
ncbi:DivIVA domain-containing protein [Lactobacillus colini]|uniref:DivIVA domain-containing protein n=1 Tax=Lactobacillus colini TaxID=1819254 RepID=A0ABS4MBU6_9LACO|nr:DivIVA domain-containing protein [Lactobacillus colini]MBP2057088.1 DivIVA domain-containing protein [Lactobacillus colini]